MKSLRLLLLSLECLKQGYFNLNHPVLITDAALLSLGFTSGQAVALNLNFVFSLRGRNSQLSSETKEEIGAPGNESFFFVAVFV